MASLMCFTCTGYGAMRSTPRIVSANNRLLAQRTFLLSGSNMKFRLSMRSPSNTLRRASSLKVKAELKVGSDLKDYADYYRVLKSSDGKGIALSNFEGKKPIVLFFYPKAGTPGCTKEACKFRDEYSEFSKAGVEVFGISNDSPEENAVFAKSQRLPFPLLTDAGGFLRKSFDIKSDFLGLLPGRQTFVIDKKGKVVLSFNDQLNAEKHVEEALNVIKKL